MPSFGLLLRCLRERRRLSRERLAFDAGVSSSYVSHLEKGAREHPTRDVVVALARSLDDAMRLRAEERRHLLDLAGLSAGEFPSTAELRTELTTNMVDWLELSSPRLAAYIDTGWNVLACNTSYAEAFPGVTAGTNMLHWLFGDGRAPRVLPDWECECRQAVGVLRGLIARSGDTRWSHRLLEDLGRYPLFRAAWIDDAAAYGRDRPDIDLHDVATGARRSFMLQLHDVPDPACLNRIHLVLGLPVAEVG